PAVVLEERARDVDRPVAVERCGLHRDRRWLNQKLLPVRAAEAHATNALLEVEAYSGENLANGSRPVEEGALRSLRHAPRAQQHGVVAEFGRDLGFANGIRRVSDDSGDSDSIPIRRRVDGTLQNLSEESGVLVQRELGRVHADGHAVDTG